MSTSSLIWPPNQMRVTNFCKCYLLKMCPILLFWPTTKGHVFRIINDILRQSCPKVQWRQMIRGSVLLKRAMLNSSILWGRNLFFIAAIDCSLLGVNTHITILGRLRLANKKVFFQCHSNNVVQRKKLLPHIMSGWTFHLLYYPPIRHPSM